MFSPYDSHSTSVGGLSSAFAGDFLSSCSAHQCLYKSLIDRQIDRKTDIQVGRQIDRYTYRETSTHACMYICVCAFECACIRCVHENKHKTHKYTKKHDRKDSHCHTFHTQDGDTVVNVITRVCVCHLQRAHKNSSIYSDCKYNTVSCLTERSYVPGITG